MKQIARLSIGLFVAVFFVAVAPAATLMVTNTNDSGGGSLRQAILDSNASVGVLDTIAFNIPGTGVHTIVPAAGFAAINDPVVIDGYTQPGSAPNTLAVGDNAVILIELAGTGGTTIGLNITAGNSTVRGLAVTRFSSTGITFSTAGGNVVEGCFVGVDPSGTAASGNGNGINFFNNASGNNRVGGTSPAQRNVISGQSSFGIAINSSNNVILGNYIGTDGTGKVKIPNSTALGAGGTNNTIGGTAAGAGNVISGNGTGLNIQGTAWTIQGNLIGTDATGTVALGNTGTAIIANGPGNHVIGGTTVAARNIISANNIGISINGADGNVIQGNYIGTDITGTVALGNIQFGIATGNSAQNTIIGGLTNVPGQPPGNVISATVGSGTPGAIGFGSGISTNTGNGSPANNAAGTVIAGNLIGTDKDGLHPLGNKIGVTLGEPNAVLGGTDPRAYNVISGSSSSGDAAVAVTNKQDVIGNLIGTDITGLHPIGNAGSGILVRGGNDALIQQNTIAYNNANGVRVLAGTGHRITSNAIYYNFLPGIDLGTAGITPNDSGDADAGANNLQNFPVITSAVNDGTNTTIVGTLNSTPNTAFNVEFFVSSVRDATGFGQGENILDTAIVTTDASGNASFNLTFSQLNDGQWFTATATDPAGNTSEFSAAVAVSGPVILNGTSVTARTGQPFRFRVFTAGGTVAQRLSAAGLPPGLNANAISGLISGTPAADGSFNVLLTVTDGAVTTTAILQIVCVSDPALPVIVSPNFAVVPSGQPFSYKIDAPANSFPGDVTTFSIFGPLPLGLTFDPITGIISGTAASVHADQIGGGHPKPLSGGALLSTIQLFATNSAGRATSSLLLLRLPPMPVNISTRLAVGTGENVLIGGFIVTGNAPKIVMVRGIGPSLTASGVPGALQDPVVELHDAAGALLALNDNWRTDQEAEIKESQIPPQDERESAIVALLDPANYTAVFRGANNSTGVGLVEAYDLGTASMDIAAAAQLANLSTRGLVGANDDVMIGGVIAANGTAKFLLRAIGPSLGSAGVQGALQDPVLELHGANGATLASNDNWKIRSDGTTQEAEIRATTIPPSNDLESALVQTVAPGNYTAIVRGKNNATGVALVELYNLQ